MIDDKMRGFGRIESVDIKRRVQHNDAFAFVFFEDIRDSQRAVKALGGSTTINGITVRACAVATLLPPTHITHYHSLIIVVDTSH